MKLATLILPNVDNDGVDHADTHAALRASLCDVFGGYTAIASHGGWRAASGKVVHEAGTLYSVAMDDTPYNVGQWRGIARFYGHAMAQESVFIVHASGAVEFVDCGFRVPA